MVNWVELPVIRNLRRVEELFDLCESTGAFVAGGFARHVCDPSGIEADDIDIFTGSWDIYNKTVERLRKTSYRECETEVSTRWTGNINLVKPIDQPRFSSSGTRDEIISKFDITLCEAYISSPHMVIVSSECYDAIQRKHITFRTLNNPCGTIWRTFKYLQKGYRIDPPEVVKLFQAYDALTVEEKARINSPFLPSQIAPEPPKFALEGSIGPWVFTRPVIIDEL